MKTPFFLLSVLGTLALPLAAENFHVYFGTYNQEVKDGKIASEGIYVADFDAESGTLGEPRLAAATRNPSFLAISPSGPWLFAVGEVGEFEGKPAGMVTAFSVDPKTGLATQTSQASSGSTGPCHVSVNRAGNIVLVANYGGGSVASLAFDGKGKLTGPVTHMIHKGSSVNEKRQKEPHAHSFVFSPDEAFAYAPDLGMDKIMIYRVNPADATLTAADPAFVALPPGSGPRHFAFHPAGDRAYTNNELLSTITSFSFNASTGALVPGETVSTLPAETPGNSTAETVVHPNGKFVYVSNRGHNSIAVFAIDGEAVKPLGHVPSGGAIPRNFALDPTGKWLFAAHQDSDNVVLFKVDPESGMPVATGREIKVGKPVCVRFLKK